MAVDAAPVSTPNVAGCKGLSNASRIIIVLQCKCKMMVLYFRMGATKLTHSESHSSCFSDRILCPFSNLHTTFGEHQFQISLLQLAGFLLPCYVMARSWYIVQCRRRRQVGNLFETACSLLALLFNSWPNLLAYISSYSGLLILHLSKGGKIIWQQSILWEESFVHHLFPSPSSFIYIKKMNSFML